MFRIGLLLLGLASLSWGAMVLRTAWLGHQSVYACMETASEFAATARAADDPIAIRLAYIEILDAKERIEVSRPAIREACLEGSVATLFGLAVIFAVYGRSRKT